MEKYQRYNNPGPTPLNNHNHLGGFLIIGGVTTLVDFFILYVLTEWIGIWYLFSAAISYCIGILLSYILNKRFNFRNKSTEYLTQGMVFLGIAGTSLVLNLGIVYAGVEWVGFSYIFAKIIATGVGCMLNYTGQSIITFKRWR